ncbi:hypothetical protein pipiens_001770 [Culex pipiens pipiens]|uniref:XPG N-terminal domain-containing protein n=1 Tax=Culex pipiens pipiens TaxID=38569 RepID=A0ABD1DVE0_CULPP
MGVRGLTTYIASNAERYLDPHELHDTALVIDGDNLCIQLFVRSEARMSPFGGNYDHFARAVVEFFELLRKCNVRPLVLLDGGYEKNKLKTVRSRMLGRIQFVARVKAGSNRLIIPLLMREVFVEALRVAKVPFMRCLFEADNEIAVLARKLDCPVLSYDSDFYIHNVKYIPYVTVNHKVYRKVIGDEENYEIELVDKRKGKRANRVLAKQGEGVVEESQISESYYYLDCSLYTIKNLIGTENRLTPEKLPLFATLLGNDYIERRVLFKFYSSMKVGKVSKKVPVPQRRIVAILRWLEHHSVKSATKAVLNQVRERHRGVLLRQLQGAMYGYNCEECASYEYFGERMKLPEELELDEEVGDEEESNADPEEDVDEPEEVEEAESEKDDEIAAIPEDTFKWEPWLLEIYQAALTPRFVADLYHSSLYINYPQVEDIARPDSNELCYDLLKFTFALLKSSKKDTPFEVTLPEGVTFNPNKPKNLGLFKVALREFEDCDQIFDRLQLLPGNLQLYFLCLVFWIRKSPHVTNVHVHALILCLIQLQIIDKRLSSKSRDPKVFQKNQKSYLEAQKKSFQKPSHELADPAAISKHSFKQLTSAVTKPEAVLTYELTLPHFGIAERHQRRNAEFDRATAHTFAELQAVVLNLLSLNALLRHPLEPARVHELYSGLFLHNAFHTMKSRADPLEYVRGTVFRYSGTLFQIYRALYGWLVETVPDLVERRTITAKAKRQLRHKEVVKRCSKSHEVVENDCVEREDSSDEQLDEFNDLNNQFSQLLMAS